MKTIEQFWSEITANEELSEKLEQIANKQELEALLNENEVDCTEEQFNEFILAKANTSGELTDEQLDTVAGGDECIGIPINYADTGSVTDDGEVTFVFSEHQRVLYKSKGNGLAEIISCRTENRYKDYYKKIYGRRVKLQKKIMSLPVYDIRMIDTNEIIYGVVQSCLAPYTFCSL
ncbi:MAG: hypothetical protein ACI4XA_01045 [Oscillospiraceae bacterium]